MLSVVLNTNNSTDRWGKARAEVNSFSSPQGLQENQAMCSAQGPWAKVKEQRKNKAVFYIKSFNFFLCQNTLNPDAINQVTRFLRIQTPPGVDSTCVKPGSGHRTFTSLIPNTEWDANDVINI